MRLVIALLDKIARKLHQYGPAATLHLGAMKALNLLGECEILRGVYVEQPDPAFLKCPAGYEAGFLAAHELRAFAGDPATCLPDEFLDEALHRNDECFAIRDGETLAAYGWYSHGPTPIDADLELNFSPDYVYMYKGFTDERYRGQRLHAVGMTMALRHYRAAGFKGLVSYVESTNYSSLRSCYRMGYKVLGSLYVLKMFGRRLTFTSPGCAGFGFRLARLAGQPQLSGLAR